MSTICSFIKLTGVKGPGTIYIRPECVEAIEIAGGIHPTNPVMTTPGCKLIMKSGKEYRLDLWPDDVFKLFGATNEECEK